jgi:ankyrin repeat domain-containing protein 50
MYENIRMSVTAILFLGTPHRGSQETVFPLVLTSIANVALAGTSRFVGSMRSDLIKSLERDSKILKDVSTNFRNQTHDIKIASFIEQDRTPPAKNRACTPL